MVRRLAVLLATAGVLQVTAIRAGQNTAAGGRGGRETPRAALDEKLAAMVAGGDIPGGLVVMATTKDHILYQGVFGKADEANNRPMTVDALFRIASMTKPVTSVAAMQLISQGRFALDDPAEKYLPELAGLSVFESFDSTTHAYRVRPAARKITIRHLFTHTSGLGYGFTSSTVRDFKPHEGEKYAAGPLMFEPGSDWLYGTSTDWLGKLVEKVSGQTLEDYFHQHIFVPLRMSDTFYNVPDAKQSRLVTVHERKDGRSEGAVTEQPNQPRRPATTFGGGGGLVSTAADYIRFVRMLLDGGELDGAQVLSPAAVALMAKNQIGDVGVRALKTALPASSMDFSFINDGRDKWGLGFLITTVGVPGKRAVGSLSWGGIDNTYFWADPTTGVGGVVMMQFLPFADTKALAVYDAFEKGVYRMVKN
jgi:CubicO group peptidase (beta-lactamase class C family)